MFKENCNRSKPVQGL